MRGLDRCFTVARACGWPEKAVVFTEFRRTQDYLRRLLEARGYSVTCLSGDVSGADRRQALVEAFRNRTQVLLMTEAGAEGLNLQFCNLVVNYDLPWNPQRVEQRIGRCHRYGQQRDVLVLNFLNRQNAADARLFDLLSQKLALFDGVFGSSDEILGALGSGIDFEKRVLDIYQSCRSPGRGGPGLRQAADRAGRAHLGPLRGGPGPALRALRRRGARQAAGGRAEDPRGGGAARGRRGGAGGRRLRGRAAAARRRRPLPGRRRRAAVPGAPGWCRRRPRRSAPAPRTRSRSWRSRTGTSPPPWGSWPGARAGGSPTATRLEALVSEEKVVHLVLWADGERFHALAPEEAEVFAALPAEEGKGGPRGATVSIGEAQEQALAALHARLVADLQERIGAAYDASRDRWDRSVEDALAAPRKAVEDARAAWARARNDPAGGPKKPAPPGPRRSGPGSSGWTCAAELSLRDRRALLERAEREYRRRLDDLRALEATRYGEKDRAIAELKKRSEIKERRTLVATAYWRCV